LATTQICHFYRDKRHDLACLLVPRERKFAAIRTILATFVVRRSLRRTSKFQPPSFLRVWDTGGQIWTLAVSAPRRLKNSTAGVIIMEKFFFHRFFSNVRSKIRVFGDTQNFGVRAPLIPPPLAPEFFFYILRISKSMKLRNFTNSLQAGRHSDLLAVDNGLCIMHFEKSI